MYVSDNFLQKRFGECGEENSMGTYDSFALAEIGCSSNMECIGIMDGKCDNDGTFHLCRKGFLAQSASCISQKKNYSG